MFRLLCPPAFQFRSAVWLPETLYKPEYFQGDWGAGNTETVGSVFWAHTEGAATNHQKFSMQRAGFIQLFCLKD
jgi:hypothetical protein